MVIDDVIVNVFSIHWLMLLFTYFQLNNNFLLNMSDFSLIQPDNSSSHMQSKTACFLQCDLHSSPLFNFLNISNTVKFNIALFMLKPRTQ